MSAPAGDPARPHDPDSPHAPDSPHDPDAPGAAPGRSVLRDVGRTVRRSDVALVYGGLVTLGAVVMAFLPPATADALVEQASGNLDNMRERPVAALVASALVLPHLSSLLLVVPLVVAVAYAQAWLGRAATVVVMVAGHVVASLVVGAVLTTGIDRGQLSPALTGADDVGVSYVLACVTGVLAARVPGRWRWWYVALLVAVWVLPGVWLRTFTDVGHATALGVGLALALVVSRAVAAAR